MREAIKFLLLTIFILSSADAQENFSDPIFGDRIDL